jgi:hypothetical protein
MIESTSFDRVVILGDESANWQIAGLRQLDRLVLGLDEFAKAMGTANKIEVVVFLETRDSAFGAIVAQAPANHACSVNRSFRFELNRKHAFSLRACSSREMLCRSFFNDAPGEDRATDCRPNGAWPRLFEQFERTCRSATRAEGRALAFSRAAERDCRQRKTPPSPHWQIAGRNGFEVFEPPDLTRNHAASP